jgi:hypothetical protein
MKTGPDATVPPKTSPGAQNMKTRPNDLGTTENESESAKTRKRDTTPPVPSKMSTRALEMKTENDPLGKAENESGSEKK